MFPPGFEPGTFRVLGERDNHYTTETLACKAGAPDLFTISFRWSAIDSTDVPARPGIGQRREWVSREAGENPTTGPPMLV